MTESNPEKELTKKTVVQYGETLVAEDAEHMGVPVKEVWNAQGMLVARLPLNDFAEMFVEVEPTP